MDDFVKDGLVPAHLLLVSLKLKLVPAIHSVKVNSEAKVNVIGRVY